MNNAAFLDRDGVLNAKAPSDRKLANALVGLWLERWNPASGRISPDRNLTFVGTNSALRPLQSEPFTSLGTEPAKEYSLVARTDPNARAVNDLQSSFVRPGYAVHIPRWCGSGVHFAGNC
jgi:hypothetical protein